MQQLGEKQIHQLANHRCPHHRNIAGILRIPVIGRLVRGHALKLLEHESQLERILPENVPENLIDLYEDRKMRAIASVVSAPGFDLQTLGVQVDPKDQKTIIVYQCSVQSEEPLVQDRSVHISQEVLGAFFTRLDRHDEIDPQKFEIIIPTTSVQSQHVELGHGRDGIDYTQPVRIVEAKKTHGYTPYSKQDPRGVVILQYQDESCMLSYDDAHRFVENMRCGRYVYERIDRYGSVGSGGDTGIVIQPITAQKEIARLSREQWGEFRKMGQRYLYGHLSRFLGAFFQDPALREAFEEEIRAHNEYVYYRLRSDSMKRSMKSERQICIATYADYLEKRTEVFERDFSPPEGHPGKIEEIVQKLPQEEQERARELMERFYDTDHEWNFVADRMMPGDFEENEVDSIRQGLIFAQTGRSDHVHATTPTLSIRSDFSDFQEDPRSFAVTGAVVIPSIVHGVIQYFHENLPNIGDEELATEAKKIARRVMARVMRQSLSRIGDIDTAEGLGLCLVEKDGVQRVGVDRQVVEDARENMRTDRAVGCPVQHHTDVWTELADMYIDDLIRYRELFRRERDSGK